MRDADGQALSPTVELGLYPAIENGHRLQADQELIRESGETGIPGVYLVCPTNRLRRIPRQRISRIDDAEVVS